MVKLSKARKKSAFSVLMRQVLALGILVLGRVFFWTRKQRIWLIGCGGRRWGDNADAFWRYMKKNHPEVRAVAVVKNGVSLSPDSGSWVYRDSLVNFVMIVQAEVLATTHTLADLGPESIISKSKAKKVWLQHGVIAIGKIKAEIARSGQYDMICASSTKEKNIMCNQLGIRPEQIKITGLARHDQLLERIRENPPRQGILYIPTARAWADPEQIDYYRESLFSWLRELSPISAGNKALNVNFWLHPGWSKSGLDDLGLNIKNISFYEIEQDPQQLICNSEILVTDYSSVFFDAALSGIPTIFFQPDRDIYMERKGLFKDFLDQGSLLVVNNNHDLLCYLQKLLSGRDFYLDRVEKDQQWAFQYVETFDGECCLRIYQEACNLLGSVVSKPVNHKGRAGHE